MYNILEIIGTIAFANSGVMIAVKKKMDILGVATLGLINAIGGGIIRDIFIGKLPPTIFINPFCAYIAIVVSLIVFSPLIREFVEKYNRVLLFVDAIGLGTFTVIGVHAGANFNNLFLQVCLGVVTGTFGGVLRDICAMEKPTIFVRNFYATASIIGAIICSLLLNYNENLAMILGIIVTVILRLLGSKYNWQLPKA